MSIDSMDYFGRMARYNRWMNTRLMDTCSQLSDAERKQPRGAPFGSIHGLWNHLLLLIGCGWRVLKARLCLTNRWTKRFVPTGTNSKSSANAPMTPLDDWIASLTEEKMASTLRFRAMSTPKEYELPFWIAAQQFFNHQTHHRGQITALMEQTGLDCGVTDIAAMP
jgi:uncharacterized damage-inducible protein DinB